ncbi:DUF3558 domain-containing protein [Umezawaea sp. NPDC059074]|uniref:DUF3558 domain-containing protein n=1 Tax=Umezawaea sp. NPDC059074 TaxID=3346716 RepID=UPI00367E1205
MRTPLLFAALAVTTLVATGCGTTTPAASAGNGTGGDTTQHGAPRVHAPLDSTKASQKPCTLLSDAQLKTLGMAGTSGAQEATPTGPICSWDDLDGTSGQHVTFTFTTGNGNGGLDRVYELKSTFQLFELQAPLQDYPALLNAPTDDRKKGTCAFVVGISDTQILTTTVKMRTGAKPAPRVVEPCIVAREAADLALTSIREQA